MPDWLRQAARTPIPSLPDAPEAVVLLDEQTIRISDTGEFVLVTHWAAKILRPSGTAYGGVSVPFDNETRITYLKAWSITETGVEYELKEKDYVDVDVSSGIHGDARLKVTHLPGVMPGTVVGYEAEQKQRPYLHEKAWFLDQQVPILKSRYQVQLAKNWRYEAFWRNHAAVAPVISGNSLVWEFTNLPAIKDERLRPPYRALAGQMVLHFSPDSSGINGSAARWKELGAWYASLFTSRAQPTPATRAKTASLITGADTDIEKIRRVAAYVQSEIRYVDIEVGIGGYQPHSAGDVLNSRFGDCKDKVALLAAMLRDAGYKVDPLLIDTNRGAVSPDVPAIMFNHVIAAITLPPNTDIARLPAVLKIAGKDVLLFDPTYEMLGVGFLPDFLQNSYALLVRDGGGELIKTPLISPEWNVVRHTSEMTLALDGALAGEIIGTMTGTNGVSARTSILSESNRDREKLMEAVISSWLPSARVMDSSIDGARKFDEPLTIKARIRAENYAKSAASLLLVRPQVVRFPQFEMDAKFPRVTSVHFPAALMQVDETHIKLPQGYTVDELPPATNVKFDFGEYHSATKCTDGVLQYHREFILRQPIIPAEQFADVQKFLRQIAIDERSSAVLKKM